MRESLYNDEEVPSTDSQVAETRVADLHISKFEQKTESLNRAVSLVKT